MLGHEPLGTSGDRACFGQRCPPWRLAVRSFLIKAFLTVSSEVALDIIRQKFPNMIGNVDIADEIMDIEEAHEVFAFPCAKKVKEQKARVSAKERELKEFSREYKKKSSLKPPEPKKGNGRGKPVPAPKRATVAKGAWKA